MKQNLRFLMLALLCAVFSTTWAETKTGTINFGNNGTKINKTSVTGQDDLENTWTITSVFSNEPSFTQSTTYSQVGASDKPATSITFTTTLAAEQNITSFEAKFGGFSKTTGDVTLKVGTTTVGSGSLDATNDVTVSSTSSAQGTVLTVTVTNIARGVKCYYISYTYEDNSNPKVATPTFNPENGTESTTKQNVTISCATDGAKIYYTTDGTDPTQSETKLEYSTAIQVTKSGTKIQAYAEKADMDPSTVASATYIIKPETPTFQREGNTVSIKTEQKGLIYYYNTGTDYNNTNDPTTASTMYTEPIEMDQNAYFKAIAYDEYGNPSGIKSFNFTYSNVVPNPKNIKSNYYVKVNNVSELENGDAILIVSSYNDIYYAMGADKGDNRAAVSVTVNNDAISITNEAVQKIVFVDASDNNNKYGYFYVGNGYLYAGSSSKNHLKTEEIPDNNNNAKGKIVFNNEGVPTITFQGSSTRNIIKYNSASSLFSCYASGQSDIQIYKEVDIPFSLTIPEIATDGNGNYYATISNLGYGNYVVPEGLEVSTITIDNHKIKKEKTFQAGNKFPGKKAYYIVANSASTFSFIPTEESATYQFDDADNWLYPAIAGVEITAPNSGNYLYYKLTLDKEVEEGGSIIGFYFGEDNGGPFTFQSDHKAYLAVPQDGNSAGLSSIAIDDTTGVSNIKTAKEQNNEVYTLSGVRVNGNLSKGVYIVNGKKKIVK